MRLMKLRILTMAMRVRKPPYSEVTDLALRLYENQDPFAVRKLNCSSGAFESSLPFSIRCRAALMAMPSRYPQAEAAIKASPEPSRSAMTLSFRVSTLCRLSFRLGR